MLMRARRLLIVTEKMTALSGTSHPAGTCKIISDGLDLGVRNWAYVFEEVAKGNTAVTSESKELSRRGSHIGHAAEGGERNHDSSHGGGTRYRTCGIVEDLDERIAGWCGENIVDVTDGITKCAADETLNHQQFDGW
jgi:hypothetical protein